MISALKRDDDGTIELTITIPPNVIKKAWDEVVDEQVKQATLPGFRKGKAPRTLIEEKLDKTSLREDVLKKLLPQAYLDAVKEHDLRPIINPKIHIDELKDPTTASGSNDWQFTARTCEVPNVDLGNYKDEIRKITAKAKIVIPGKEPTAPNFDEIVKALLASIKITIPSVLIEQEVERLLSRFLQDVQKLGLTLDQYLTSTGKTTQGLRKEYEEKAKTDLAFEFALGRIAEEEHITVEEKEIDEAIQKAKDEREKEHLQKNRYLLASILRQQKTLDFLKNL